MKRTLGTRSRSMRSLRMIASLVVTALTGFTTGASAQALGTVYAFGAYLGDGTSPGGGLISDGLGGFYGTTISGGAYGYGTVFHVAPPVAASSGWTETVLYSFTGGSDGGNPIAGVISDMTGALYGTTFGGGKGHGTVFKLTPSSTTPWPETVLYSFTGGLDGGNPEAGLISDADGALYGTTNGGGAYVKGTAYKLAPSQTIPWTETVLWSFSGGSDGEYPTIADLLSDGSGGFYGTTFGSASSYGTVFHLMPPPPGADGWRIATLWTFTGGSDGGYPDAGLMSDMSGALYGATIYGGTGGNGTVYQLTPAATTPWPEAVLYSFTAGSDGGYPDAPLLLDASGAVYGTTFAGGAGYGAVFKLAPSAKTPWPETVLWRFSGASDGGNPAGGLTADASGRLYGTTRGGGSFLGGTVFALSVPAIFTGVPGKANCVGQTTEFLARKYGGIAAAATNLGYPGVAPLEQAVTAYCSG